MTTLKCVVEHLTGIPDLALEIMITLAALAIGLKDTSFIKLCRSVTPKVAPNSENKFRNFEQIMRRSG